MSTPLDGLGLENLENDISDDAQGDVASFNNVSMTMPGGITPSLEVKPFFWRDDAVRATMNGMGCGPQQKNPLLIRTSDNVNYRIFMRTEMTFDANYVNQICRFLDGRTANQTVSFILGTRMDDWQAHIVGGIISAIEACKAKTIMYAMGYCGITETMLWCFGNERYIARYGALTFGQTNIIKISAAYVHYFQQCYDRAQSLGALTEAEATQAKDSGVPLMKLYYDLPEFQLKD